MKWSIIIGGGNKRILEAIMAELQNLEEAVGKVEEDAIGIASHVTQLNQQVTDLQTQVADLQAQLAAATAGVDPAAVQAIADRVNAVDASFDAIVPVP